MKMSAASSWSSRWATKEYGIDILKVQEIRGYDAATVTRIANVRPSSGA